MAMRSLRSVWWLPLALSAILLLLGLRVLIPLYRYQVALETLNARGGRLQTESELPDWLAEELPFGWELAFTRVTGAAFDHCRLTDAEMVHIAGLRSLISLSLRGTAITDAGLRSLSGLSELESLSLRATSVTDAGIEEVARLPKLKTLFVGMSETTPAGLARIRRERPDLEIFW
jgi:hypothetical protein